MKKKGLDNNNVSSMKKHNTKLDLIDQGRLFVKLPARTLKKIEYNENSDDNDDDDESLVDMMETKRLRKVSSSTTNSSASYTTTKSDFSDFEHHNNNNSNNPRKRKRSQSKPLANNESCFQYGPTANNSLKRNRHKIISSIKVENHDESSNYSMASCSTKSTISTDSSMSTTSIYDSKFSGPTNTIPHLTNFVASPPPPQSKTAKMSPKKLNNSKILVPNWRVKVIRKGFKLEGTENMLEDFYLKKHQKHENEEIRIKRNDMRRQREELMREKLLQRQNQVVSSVPTIKSSKNCSKKVDMEEQDVYMREFNESLLDDIEEIQIVSEDELLNAKQLNENEELVEQQPESTQDSTKPQLAHRSCLKVLNSNQMEKNTKKKNIDNNKKK